MCGDLDKLVQMRDTLALDRSDLPRVTRSIRNLVTMETRRKDDLVYVFSVQCHRKDSSVDPSSSKISKEIQCNDM